MVKSLADYAVDEDAFNLVHLLERTLETVGAVYASYGVPLPTRQYWALREPSEDCEQVVVSFLQMYLGAPGDQANQPRRCASAPRSAVLEIRVTRNYPIGANGKAVSASDIMASSRWGAVDAWILEESMAEFDKWGDGMGPGIIATVQAEPPGGGLQTVVMNLTVAVP